MTNLLLKALPLLLLVACQSNSTSPAPTQSDASSMRHGWAIFTGPQPTAVRELDGNSIARGKLVYMNNCQGCHGKTGKGDGDIAKTFNIKPANLKALAGQQANHYLVVQINQGKGSMPMWQDLLTTQQTWDVTNYIQSLNKKSQ